MVNPTDMVDPTGQGVHDRLEPGVYRHFKGALYEVIGVARDSETEQPFVVYRPQYGERRLWIRPLAMFTEAVERDGRRQPRFEYVGPVA